MSARLRRAASLAARWRAAAAPADPPVARGFAAAAWCEPAVLHRVVHRRPDASRRRTVKEAPSRAKALLLLLPGGVAAGLGVWQLQRQEQKAEQLAERTRQLAAEPLPLSAATASSVGEWRRVLCKGELRHDAAAYVRHLRWALPCHCSPRRISRARRVQVGPRVRNVGGTARSGYLLVRQPRCSCRWRASR